MIHGTAFLVLLSLVVGILLGYRVSTHDSVWCLFGLHKWKTDGGFIHYCHGCDGTKYGKKGEIHR